MPNCLAWSLGIHPLVMFVRGYETKSANVTANASDVCPRCKSVTSHTIRVEWQIVHLYVYIRQVRWERWIAKCLNCGTEHLMEPVAVETARMLPTADPIPIFDRWGGAIALVVIAAFLALLWWLRNDG
jgi:hypothetical protein